MSPVLIGLVVAGCAVVAALAGWPLTRGALWLASGRERRTAEEDAPATVRVGAPEDDDGLLRGGLWIGLLERALVAGAVALGEPTVLAVVVAIKGLGRVPELLRSPSAGERFMIGSLASLSVALVCGAIGRALIG